MSHPNPVSLFLLAGAALLAACGTSSPKPAMKTPVPVPATPAALAALEEVDLKAAHLVAGGTKVALPAEKPPVLQFLPDGRVAGFSGVNRFNGSYKLGQNGVITWSPAMTSTRMADEPERMKLEGSFLKALQATTRLGVLPYGVVFQSDDGKNVVELVK